MYYINTVFLLVYKDKISLKKKYRNKKMKSNSKAVKTNKTMKSKQTVVNTIIDWAVEAVSSSGDTNLMNLVRDSLSENKNQLTSIISSSSVSKSSKKVKDPDAPKRGKSSYIYFCLENRDKIKKKNPEMDAKDLTKELGRMWREDVSDEEKAKYVKMSEKDKSRYEKEKETYVPSENVSKKKKNTGPKRALSPYIFFCKDYRKQLKEENPDMTAQQITSELGKRWSSLSDKEKSKYEKLAEKDKERYEKAKSSGSPSESKSDEEEVVEEEPEQEPEVKEEKKKSKKDGKKDKKSKKEKKEKKSKKDVM